MFISLCGFAYIKNVPLLCEYTTQMKLNLFSQSNEHFCCDLVTTIAWCTELRDLGVLFLFNRASSAAAKCLQIVFAPPLIGGVEGGGCGSPPAVGPAGCRFRGGAVDLRVTRRPRRVAHGALLH